MSGYWQKGVEIDPVWGFDEQEELPFIYHTDPKDICGHWHKVKIYSTPCIDYLNEVEPGVRPPPSGLYRSGDAALYNSDDGYVYGGSGYDGTIFRINPATMTVSEQTTFPDADVSGFVQLVLHEGSLHCLVKRAGYVGTWIQKITMPAVGGDFVLDGDPLYSGSVVTGTDSKIYGSVLSCIMVGSYTAWWKPVTGALWASGWEELPGSYPYHIGAYVDWTGGITTGAKVINMVPLPNNNYLINGGPESGFAGSSAYIHEIESDGVPARTYKWNTTTGPNELVANEWKSKAATLRSTSVITNLTLRVITVGVADSSVDYPIVGLLNNQGQLEDKSGYHKRTIWNHNNNLIYSLHSIYPNLEGRIIAVDEMGNLVYQYAIAEDQLTAGSFVILGDFIYVWQNSVTDVGYTSSVIKLTLELEFVCRRPCPGGVSLGISTETGSHIVSDGEQFLFNFGQVPAPTRGVMTEYLVYPPVSVEVTECDPVWPFTKQPNTYI